MVHWLGAGWPTVARLRFKIVAVRKTVAACTLFGRTTMGCAPYWFENPNAMLTRDPTSYVHVSAAIHSRPEMSISSATTSIAGTYTLAGCVPDRGCTSFCSISAAIVPLASAAFAVEVRMPVPMTVALGSLPKR
jgi:hypothetical protein